MNFISGERLQCLCDISIITPDILNFHQNIAFKTPLFITTFKEPELEEKIKILDRCISIFVYTHLLDNFFIYIYPKIKNPFYLVTHNSDHHITHKYLPYLDEEKIIHWYAQNINLFHEKLSPLPIGIANSQWKHGNMEIIKKISYQPIKKTHLLYINFNINTNIRKRQPIYNLFKKKNIGTFQQNQPFQEYLKILKSHKFCLVPPGNGIDCHRTWECLYLGVIPIVEKHPHNTQLAKHLPLLVVEDWNIITEEYLNNYYKLHSFKPEEQMFLKYYKKKLC